MLRQIKTFRKNSTEMITKGKLKFIHSLRKKKVREEEQLFVIEGDKLVKEFLMAKAQVITLIAKPEFIGSLPLSLKSRINEIEPVSYDELKKISSLKTPHNALAVVRMPGRDTGFSEPVKELSVVLDSVQDPGNLGTIVRAAGWFGIKTIFCSEDCVDIYNPKVIQASMGAILNVNVQYTNIGDLLKHAAEAGISVYGTMLEGEPIYSRDLGPEGVIVLGNESKGISPGLYPFIQHRVTIPRFNESVYGIDSLNVGMAASVIFSEFARRRFSKY
jgi:RNA methyltransferase, TrmH family